LIAAAAAWLSQAMLTAKREQATLLPLPLPLPLPPQQRRNKNEARTLQTEAIHSL
jgi:hypothetical protein